IRVIDRRADGGDDALADTGDDRFLGGAADQSLDVRADGDLGLHLQLDAVLGDRVDGAAAHRGIGDVDDLRIHAGLDGVEDVAAGEVDRGGVFPRQVDVGLVGGDHRVDDPQ